MGMKFRAIDSVEPVAQYVADIIGSHLSAGEHVLWLVAGGSSIRVAAKASKYLIKDGSPLEKLVVTLTDERFGPIGHVDANWQQLKDAGFSVPGAHTHAVLENKSQAATVADFEHFLKKAFAEANFKIGVFGIGADGHTSGILPGSSAVHAKSLVHGYDGVIYQRITTTPVAIAKLDEAVAYVIGEAKRPVLEQLSGTVSMDKQPAQVLKKVPKTIIFNDYKGDTV